MGNHAGAAYATVLLPPAPNNYPPNINYFAPGFTYKLRPDEAVVIIGQTPPPAVYFDLRSYLAFVQNKPGKVYSKEDIVAGDAETGFYHGVFGGLGDQLNNFNIWTDNTQGGTEGNPFNSSTRNRNYCTV